MKKHTTKTKGFGLIEIVLASAIISSALVGLTATAQLASSSLTETAHRAKARFLAEEAVEVVRIMRDTSWDTHIAGISDGSVRYPVFSEASNTWTLAVAEPPLIDERFEREVVFDDVYRDDTTDDIVQDGASGSYVDSGTRRITARVMWGDNTIELKTYIADLFDN